MHYDVPATFAEQPVSQPIVYPNPAVEVVTITTPPAFSCAHITVTQVSVRLVISGRIRGDRTQLDITDLKPELFFIIPDLISALDPAIK